MSTKTQSIFLAIPEKHTQHQIHAQAKKYGVGLLYMWKLYTLERRDLLTSFHEVQQCKKMLATDRGGVTMHEQSIYSCTTNSRTIDKAMEDRDPLLS